MRIYFYGDWNISHDIPFNLYHKHVPTLRALSAIAARPLLDARHQHTRSRSRARERLPTQLLHWIDDLYAVLNNSKIVRRATSSDVLWLLTPLQSSMLTAGPGSLDDLETVISLFGHLSVGRSAETEFRRLVEFLESIMEYNFPAQSFCYVIPAALQRIYASLISRVGARSARVDCLTMAVLRQYPRQYIRHTLARCDQFYAQRFAYFSSNGSSTYHRLYCAFADNDLDTAFFISAQTDVYELASVIELCLLECDAVFLDKLLSEIDITVLSANQMSELFQSAGLSGDVAVLRTFMDHVHPRLYSSDVLSCDSIWSFLSDIACAELLVASGYMYESAVDHCSSSNVKQYLLSRMKERS